MSCVLIIVSAILLFSGLNVPQTVSGVQENDIDWYSYSNGMDKAENEGKPVFIDFMTEWCGACEEMEDETYSDPRVQEKTEEVIFIKVNVDEREDLGSKYGIQSVPTLVFESPQGEEVDRSVGFMGASDLEERLDKLSNNFGEQSGEGDDVSDIEGDPGEKTPFWRSMIFLNIVGSLIAAGVIIMILKHREKEGDEGEK
ncbi:MAG: thioredoxin family protein [Candidatus Thermoplasmatota archaeon]